MLSVRYFIETCHLALALCRTNVSVKPKLKPGFIEVFEPSGGGSTVLLEFLMIADHEGSRGDLLGATMPELDRRLPGQPGQYQELHDSAHTRLRPDAHRPPSRRQRGDDPW